MKTHRKLSKALALCLTLLMAIGLFGTTAFAIEPDAKGTIRINGAEDGVAVSAYQLMTVSYDYIADQPVQPVYTWTDDVADWVRGNYPDYIGTGTDNSVQSDFSSEMGASDIAAFYDALAAAIKGRNLTLTADGTRSGSGDIGNLSMGNYLILIENGLKIYHPAAVNLVPEWQNNSWQMTTPAVVEVEVKSSEPTVIKTVKAPNTQDGREKDNASIGDTMTFDIRADVPHYPASATSKNYAISDVLPGGLTLTANSIAVYGVKSDTETPLTNNGTAYYTQSNARPNNGGNSAFTLTFDYDTISTYDEIHVTYTAVLNGSAVLGENGNENNAYLDYTSNPYVTGDWGGEANDTATVYTYGLDISKVDKENHSTYLPGAEFELYASQNEATSGDNKIAFIRESEGVYRKAWAGESGTTTTLTVGATASLTGKLTLKGLDEGIWYLKETKAPDRYNLLASPVQVTITDTDAGTLDGKVDNAKGENGEDVALVTLMVENDDGFRLPVTGGIGTILFTAVGVVLMGAAVVLLIVVFKKKKAENE